MDNAKQIFEQLLAWYRASHRALPWREDRDPYHVWLSEVMLQQTRVETVKTYYARFLQAFPTIASLAAAPTEACEKLWEGLGYYRRVRNLQKGARQVMDEHGGVFPQTYGEILSLCGVGDYTAGAIASICFDLPTPAVDGNVERVYARLFAEQPTRKQIAEKLRPLYAQGNCGELTQALMELGAVVCVPNGAPHCELCPLADICKARAQNAIALFPRRKPKKPNPVEEKTVFLLTCGDRIALRKRTDQGLLAGLWELPNVEGFLTVEQMLRQAERWGVHPLAPQKIVQAQHVFTHRTWRMQCCFLTCAAAPDDFVWATAAELDDTYALPTAFRKLLSM